MNINEHLKLATRILQASGIAEAVREAKSLLAFALNKNQTFLVARSEYELAGEEEKRFENYLNRRARREPFQYITGVQEFFGLDFAVTPDVLIPRPETELIVEAAIEILKTGEKFCEVGIGSGCISIAILHELKTASAIGLDISGAALKIAKTNAESHRVSARLELKMSDVYENLSDEKFSLIVSNPPYISTEEIKILQPEVREFEPLTALTDGADGFSIIEKIIKGAPRFLKRGGFLLMEIGFKQSTEVLKMFDKPVWNEVKVLPDQQGIPRTVKARIR